MLIYCENGNLTIRKPNGLEWQYENTDRPELGFEYDVLVYDDIEVKIMKWQEDVPFDNQEKITLGDDEVDAIEQYIENSSPPEHVNLNNQYSEYLVEQCNNYCAEQVRSYGFTEVIEVIAAGREGSNHPLRSDARRVLEYYDAVWNVYVNVANEIKATREDLLLDYEHYLNQLPRPQQALIG
tara:strand:- start:111 stop:656 length:546 start_codon:yes stop_codon:yes gene_type:complete